jgi:glucan phosphoethanolaminetransferase (alkaline phosphatase superfamily)
LLFSEFKDIVDSLKSIAPFIAIAIAFVIATLALLSYFLKKLPLKSYKLSTALLLILMLIFPLFVNKKRVIYIPNSTHLSYLNTFFATNLWILNKFSKKTKKNYKPYIVKKESSGKKVVIVIMGESLNYKRMHLFGWDVNNTPNLDKLSKDSHFIFKRAISSGVNTPVSIVSFFNLKREPQNVNLLLSQKTNLLKLAKENNYSTYWLSLQEEGTSISTLLNYANYKKTRKDFIKKYDEALINELKKIPNKKTFIILHLRANHSPYEEYTPKKFYKWDFHSKDYATYKRKSYYDSVLYVDYVISRVIEYAKSHFKDYSIYFTSDHGEMLGFKDEGGRFGHSQLVFGDTFVPFLYYSDTKKELNKTFYNHYQIGKMIAKDLGYKIINPNENGTYFVNGVSIDGSSGWMEYKFTNCKNPKNPKECIKENN